jgi:hypothetical protein
MAVRGKPQREKGAFQVAVKILLRHGDTLLITHDVFGEWDLPGGRLLALEFGGDIRDVLARKMREELGECVQYGFSGPKVCFQVERIECDMKQPVRIFGIGFEAEYLGGEIQLGPHHDRYIWANTKTFEPQKYFRHGWELGVSDYLEQLDFGR